MSQQISDLAAKVGVRFFAHQLKFLAAAETMNPGRARACLYYKTGAGKTITALAGITLLGYEGAVVVVAPPSTHKGWEEWGRKFGLEVQAMSHAKFRMKDTKLSRTVPVIVDEFHMLGGAGGQGWKKLDRLAAGLQASVLILSATPNYNDAERVYCVKRILDPASCAGGYLQFLYQNCNTRQNPYGMQPLVDEEQPFLHHQGAPEFLASLPGVFYLPDDLVYTIDEIDYHTDLSPAMEEFGYDERNHKMLASLMEERHTRAYQQLVDEQGRLHRHVFEILLDIAGQATTPLMVYADHATVAVALGLSLAEAGCSFQVVTGATPKRMKDAAVELFRDGKLDVLVGTASLATGTDGLDKVCDWLVILDDTSDDSLRRQLIGRIMPRGEGGDASTKHVLRLVHV